MPMNNLSMPRFIWMAMTLAFLSTAGLSAEDASKNKPRSNVATLVTKDASVMAREAPEKTWQVIKQKGAITSGDLLVGLPGASLKSKNQAVQLNFLSDLSNTSPFPILESAVRLHSAGGHDLDFTLDRGRVEVANVKEKGAAHVRFRFYTNEVWELTLNSPGTRVVVEYFGRWRRGARFLVEPPKGRKHEPLLHLTILIMEGSVQRKCPSCELFMKAPPGPAVHTWDNVSGKDPAVQRLAKLPKWVKEDSSNPLVKTRKQKLDEFRAMVVDKGLDAALQRYVSARSETDRRLGVIAAGAFDRLDLIGDTLLRGAQPDTWNDAVTVVRHWIGRAAGMDRLFYQKLIEKRNLKPAHAQIIVQLLNGFTDVELGRPETYEILIDYLEHNVVGIRGLANWHLQRIVPNAKIAYNPTGDAVELKRARAQWKKLIPDGKLPPKPKADNGKTKN